MEPRIQYCTASDGVNLAFCTQGEGAGLVYMPTFGTVGNIQVDWEIPARRQTLEYLTKRMRVVQYDRRGQGLSDRNPASDSLDDHVSDVLTILDRQGIERAALRASIFAGPVAITFAARHPDRVSHLILDNTAANMREAITGSVRPRALVALLDIDWELHIEVVSRIVAGWSENEIAARVAAQARACNTLEGMRRNWRVIGSWDASELLARITAPALVVESPASPFFERETRAIAAGIPGAQLCHLSVDQGEPFAQTVYEFVTGEVVTTPVSAQPLPAGTAIILFTDIVDSTALTEQLGDAAFRTRASQLDAAMRSGMRECGGRPIDGKVLGDGVMAVFTSARQGIAGALRCLATADGTGLGLHIGIHAGDVLTEGENVYGGAVNIASRIAALCEPGEILVSRTVADLARTSAGVTFEDRGEHTLKGVGEPQRVYAVRAAGA
jgi:class 3 adenylate cyclase/pimeloyl-ACP methyl ester carboxylesterase